MREGVGGKRQVVPSGPARNAKGSLNLPACVGVAGPTRAAAGHPLAIRSEAAVGIYSKLLQMYTTVLYCTVTTVCRREE